MNIRNLEYFHAVLDHGGIGPAAELVGRTPPAITKALQRLAADVGAELLIKEGRRLVPTQIGLVLADRTRMLSSQIAQARDEIQDLVILPPFHRTLRRLRFELQ